MSNGCDLATNHLIHLKTIQCLRRAVKQLKQENDALQKSLLETQKRIPDSQSEQPTTDLPDSQSKRLRISAQHPGTQTCAKESEKADIDLQALVSNQWQKEQVDDLLRQNNTMKTDIRRLTDDYTAAVSQRNYFATQSARWKAIFDNAYIYQRGKYRRERGFHDYPCDDAAACVPNLILFADGVGAGGTQSGNVARAMVHELAKLFTVNPFRDMSDSATKPMLLQKNCQVLESMYKTGNVQRALQVNPKGSTTLTYATIDHKNGCFVIQGLQLGDGQCALLSMSSADLRWTCEYITTNSYVNKVQEVPSQLGLKISPKHVTQELENAAELISFRVPDCKKYLFVWGTDGLWDNLGVDNKSSSRVEKLLSICNAVTPLQREAADMGIIVGQHLAELTKSVMSSQGRWSKKDDITFGVSSISLSCDAFLNDSSHLFSRKAFCKALFHDQVQCGLEYQHNAPSTYFENLMCAARIRCPSTWRLLGFEPWVFKTLMCDCQCGRDETSCPKAHSAMTLRCKLYSRFGMCPFPHCCLQHTITSPTDLQLVQKQA